MTTPIETEQRERVVAAELYRPGVFRCATCRLKYTTPLVNAEGKSCPTGCGPMEPVSWKAECLDAELTEDEAASIISTGRALQQENERLREALHDARGWIALDALEAERAEALTRKDAADLMLKGIDQVLYPLPSQGGEDHVG